jgi:hypothetical protein
MEVLMTIALAVMLVLGIVLMLTGVSMFSIVMVLEMQSYIASKKGQAHELRS